jgi:hypothetical protein
MVVNVINKNPKEITLGFFFFFLARKGKQDLENITLILSQDGLRLLS